MRILWPAKCRVVVKLDTGTDSYLKGSLAKLTETLNRTINDMIHCAMKRVLTLKMK